MDIKRKLIPLLMILSLMSTSCMDEDIFNDTDTSQSPKDTSISNTNNVNKNTIPLTSNGKYSTSLSTNDDGTLSIARSMRETSEPMGEDGTWTIFVYICGTDLESKEGSATLDLEEMVNATSSNDYKFIVQTGGTTEWQNDYINPDKIQRFIIQDGDISLVDEKDDANMGDSETLSDFLVWGVQEYPADNMGVILWNHGGGSVYGVCFDETEDSDSLTSKEIDTALTVVYPYMTEKFEFIGFDACLMSAIETANILVPHANYMVASQETESGYGWDYTSIGNYLAENPNCNGAELGTEICDSFYKSSAESYEEYISTLSCIDLSKLDTLIENFNYFYEDIYNVSSDSNTLANISRSITSIENFGGNNKAEGYTNMVDLGCMVESLFEYSDNSNDVISALNDCVVYTKNGEGKAKATGLSIYYPLTLSYSEELDILKDICISPYYMSFIDMLSYGNSYNGDTSNYSNDIWFGSKALFWNQDETTNYQEEYNIDYWDASSEFLVEFSENPHIIDDGYYSFTISPDTLDYTDSVYCNIMRVFDDGSIDDMGTDNYVDIDWSTGIVTDCFEGWWYMLSDGQPLAMYIVEEGEDYDIYTSPVYINYEETNLRIKYDYNDDSISILGTCNGIDEFGQASRDTYQLQVGDIISPIYDYYYEDDEGYINYSDYYAADDYVYTGTENDILLDYLPAGDYYYAFEIYDIFGGCTVTDYVTFSVDEDGEIYYYEY